MANTTLLLGPDSLPRLSSLSGNIDIDALTPFIYTAQKNKIRTILTVPLYNKILADFTADTLTGEYLLIYDEFVVDMLVYFATADFLKMGTKKVTNAGIFKPLPDNAESVDLKEKLQLVSDFELLGNAVELVFIDYMKGNPLPEYHDTTFNSLGLDWYLND